MSVKEELTDLKWQRGELEGAQEAIRLSLEVLERQATTLRGRKKNLEGRKSSLAQKLIAENESKLDEVGKEIAKIQKQKEELEKRLSENEGKIIEREENTVAYIQEQVEQMIPEVLQYIGENIEGIGTNISEVFDIRDVGRLIESRYGNYWGYTGNLGVYEGLTKEPITRSKDFYFDKTLYTEDSDGYDAVICIPTEWYKEYFSDFCKIFLRKLKESYCYGETLSLTIDETGFTLELV